MKPIEIFYDECIGSKIRQCDMRASRITHKTHCVRRRAEINRAQAAFYEDNKDRLIQKMMRNGVGRDLTKINASLIEAFLQVFPAKTFSIENELQYLDLLYEGEEYPRDEISRAKMADPVNDCHRNDFEPDKILYLYDLPWGNWSLIGEDD
jgi:hypothetical protein